MRFVITVGDVIVALMLVVAILLIVVGIGISWLRKMGEKVFDKTIKTHKGKGAEEEYEEPPMDDYYHDHDEFYDGGAEE